MPLSEAHIRAVKKYQSKHRDKMVKASTKYIYKRREDPEYLAKYKEDDRRRHQVKRDFLVYLQILLE
jgi:hypothetical protein